MLKVLVRLIQLVSISMFSYLTSRQPLADSIAGDTEMIPSNGQTNRYHLSQFLYFLLFAFSPEDLITNYLAPTESSYYVLGWLK